jgi:hypothetical protein
MPESFPSKYVISHTRDPWNDCLHTIGFTIVKMFRRRAAYERAFENTSLCFRTPVVVFPLQGGSSLQQSEGHAILTKT